MGSSVPVHAVDLRSQDAPDWPAAIARGASGTSTCDSDQAFGGYPLYDPYAFIALQRARTE